MLIQGVVGPNRYSAGANNIARTDKDGQFVVEMNGRLYENAYNQRLFTAGAIVTAPVIFSTAAGTGGPLLWNKSATVNIVLLKVGFSTTVVTTVAAGLGITGAVQGTATPTATTGIDFAVSSTFVGTGPASLISAFRVGTPANAGAFFLPFAQLHTGALTVDTTGVQWVDFEGSIICPPQSWISVAASATATTTVAQIAMLWAEVPV